MMDQVLLWVVKTDHYRDLHCFPELPQNPQKERAIQQPINNRGKTNSIVNNEYCRLFWKQYIKMYLLLKCFLYEL